MDLSKSYKEDDFVSNIGKEQFNLKLKINNILHDIFIVNLSKFSMRIIEIKNKVLNVLRNTNRRLNKKKVSKYTEEAKRLELKMEQEYGYEDINQLSLEKAEQAIKEIDNFIDKTKEASEKLKSKDVSKVTDDELIYDWVKASKNAQEDGSDASKKLAKKNAVRAFKRYFEDDIGWNMSGNKQDVIEELENVKKQNLERIKDLKEKIENNKNIKTAHARYKEKVNELKNWYNVDYQ